MLEAVSGKRGRQYRMREHLFQLGPAAKEVITEIIYAEPRSWNDSIERLHELLQLYGDDALRASFQRHRGQPGCRVADIAREFALDQFPLPFSTASSSAAASSRSKDPPCAPATSTQCRVSLTRRLPHETSSQPFCGSLFGCARISGKILPE